MMPLSENTFGKRYNPGFQKGENLNRFRLISLILLGLLAGLGPAKAPAIERGMPEYGNGAQNFFAGVVPPPGFYTSYNLVNYQANTLAGRPSNTIPPRL